MPKDTSSSEISPNDTFRADQFSPFENWILDHFYFPGVSQGIRSEMTILGKEIEKDQCASFARREDVMSQSRVHKVENPHAVIQVLCRCFFEEPSKPVQS